MPLPPDATTVIAARDGDLDARDRLVADCLPLVYNIVGRGRPADRTDHGVTRTVAYHEQVAGVAELADAPGLGPGVLRMCGFESRLPHGATQTT